MTETYLTDRLPGTGGRIKVNPEDFRVEEMPLYPPCGEGEHLFLDVEKQGLTTFELLHRVAGACGLRQRDLGYAGLKDARATTRQTISLPGISPEQARTLELEGVRILGAIRHRNKLRPGHLAGNRFVIRIREVPEGAGEAALDILHVLADLGVPNRFGPQRYGVLGNSHRVGRALLRGEYDTALRHVIGDPGQISNARWRLAAEAFAGGDLKGALAALPGRFRDERRALQVLHDTGDPCRAVLSLPRKLLRLYLSAYQSSLFDRLVTMRLGSVGTLWPGDLACKHANGACFTVVDPAAEQPRADAFEISPSGPLFGYKVPLADGQAGLLERALLDKEGLVPGDFRPASGPSLEGERRPLRVPLGAFECEPHEDGLVLRFSLPRGSYATSVLAEVMKPEQGPDGLAGVPVA